LILGKREICRTRRGNDPMGPCTAVGWLMFTTVAADTNGDQQLSEMDQVNLGVANPDGTGYQDVLTGLDEILSILELNADTVLVVYRKGVSRYAVDVSLRDRKAGSPSALPAIEIAATETQRK
jgi:hypothetical protein